MNFQVGVSSHQDTVEGMVEAGEAPLHPDAAVAAAGAAAAAL